MSDLIQKKCLPREGGIPPLSREKAEELLKQVPGWELEEWPVAQDSPDKHLVIVGKFKFKDFKEALEFVDKVGELAEKEVHHPEIEFGWGHAKISLWTHSINGLHENDFIIAAKINELVK